ncbi:phenylalanine 4-monooxygenase [Thalassotalea agarivorans]|uniref:Phenylalanine-4-hydroxylase n=1 Tax=Thalassotalea agarivorans TaxID=349064 RepID=A0A1H9ZTR2_THASX|nr:phenylalanine 4-monooxygenase [Thalassotalea agarivorans]SES84209.1 Phenylalanine 4-hydroxylase [Thalassotalea agarivorans]
MGKATKYISKVPNDNGVIDWTDEENTIWHELITRQLDCIKGKACDEYWLGLDKLDLPRDRVPQLDEVSAVLTKETGWQCYPVPALIGFEEFFRLLSERKFPVATFIRSREEFDYLQEPDIFHEIFGHCPLLTNKSFADFTQAYGQMGLNASKEQRVFLARLYWFTVEFGLLKTDQGYKIYGGGILSSPAETEYAINGIEAQRDAFDMLTVLRTPYRIDIMQPVYYCLSELTDLDKMREYSVEDVMDFIKQAQTMGLLEAKFQQKAS